MSEQINLKPSFWGPHAWFFLDNVAFSYPKKPSTYHKKLYKDFFISIGNILPCESCRIHFKQNIKKNPLTDQILSNREAFIEWFFSIHNLVRSSQGKSLFTPAQIMKYYDNAKNFKSGDTIGYDPILIFVICILISVIGYLLYEKRLKDKSTS